MKKVRSTLIAFVRTTGMMSVQNLTSIHVSVSSVYYNPSFDKKKVRKSFKP